MVIGKQMLSSANGMVNTAGIFLLHFPVSSVSARTCGGSAGPGHWSLIGLGNQTLACLLPHPWRSGS